MSVFERTGSKFPFLSKGKPGLIGKGQGNTKPQFSDISKRGLDVNKHRATTQIPESKED